ncbi:MAG: BtrH N-terminal domain-containing protein [Promethearchaeota archaeon]
MVKNFKHRIGSHCESASMRDLFEYYGFPMSEAMAFGLDGTMGFGFFDMSDQTSFVIDFDIPFFLGGKQGTIDPNSLACRLLGITLRKQSFTSADKAWEESKRLIKQNVPLIIRVDIVYMPYEDFGNQSDETHFGGHAITLAGFDEEKGLAYLGDTEFDGFQSIPISILKTARSSTYGPKFLHPQNTQFSMKCGPDNKHPPLAAGIKLAIQQVVNNMLRASMNYNGIQGLKRFASSILSWDDKLKKKVTNSKGHETYLASIMFDLIYGYIETWGTGGACFRNLYKNFLEELIQLPEIKKGPMAWKNEEIKIIEDCLPLIDGSRKKWTLFAQSLKNSVEEYESECLLHVNLNELQNTVLDILKNEEILFKNLSRIKI